MGYYDTFKLRGTSIRDSKVNMNRIKLGSFWDSVINMLENNHLPHDFHRRGKWVNASQFYKLVVEPLDIADYYRNGMHKIRGHYIQHGRERRYQIIDRWWKERMATEVENNNRSKLASFTKDSCFWARVEEAKDSLDKITGTAASLWKDIKDFEKYATGLVESKQVSKDVLVKNSSYVLLVEELEELRSQSM